ncbi:NAD-dependent epimerase/dehydratase family protein [Lutispora sp.]|uniref:NAD-dependent epimerase/dehydratase family protein n=1 Tax=Lutispora sp. TaxID=2828727 RepID=UPI002B20DCF1|nr:NAD-dependent epimerase/dehydratase family protein [Lutispora sp.]MEA4962020.1 NAD-dependent epimerase/dehydratase family protein [Lutispora sp.]
MGINKIILEDIIAISEDVKAVSKLLEGQKMLITGGGGFIGAYLLDFIDYCNKNVFDKPASVICIENYKTGSPVRIKHLEGNENFSFLAVDVSKPFEIAGNIDYVIHTASIASPTYYRKYPIETIETNVWGLKNLLDLSGTKKVKSILFFSSSEIYGDPSPDNIPTKETYNGNVSCIGPRACYDESKRLGETLCINYYKQYGLPVKIVRPFNIYGPGLRLGDKRVIPDFFNDAINQGRIEVLSDGTPTRSFCYISDAVSGFIKVLMSDHNGEAFNIGNDEDEISIYELAQKIAGIVGNITIYHIKSKEHDYLTDNPQRRCPDLSKSRSLIDYNPRISIDEGLSRLKRWYMNNCKI